MKKLVVGLVVLAGLVWPQSVAAKPKLGIHLLDPRELPAAPNGKTTAEKPTLINQIDDWAAYAYANPAFAGSMTP